MSTVLANPAKMIARGAPRIIHNDRELETYTKALFELTALENPSPSELEAIELLTLLIERYEEGRYPIPAADAASVVRFLIESQNLTQRDPTRNSGRKARFPCSCQDSESSRWTRCGG